MGCPNCSNGCVETTSDKCVKYTGLDVPELGIYKGDSLLTVIEKITSNLVTSTTTSTTTSSPTTTTTTTAANCISWIYNVSLYNCSDCSPTGEGGIVNSEPLTVGYWYNYAGFKMQINSLEYCSAGAPVENILDSSGTATCEELICPSTTTTTTTTIV